MQPAPGPEAAASGPRRVRPVTASLAVLAVSLAVTALVVTTAADAWSLPPAPQLLVDAVVGTAYPVVGALMVLAGRLARGARQLAWVLLGAGLASAAAALTTALAMTAPAPTDLARLWSQLQSFLWVPGFLPLLTLVPLLYPDGLLPWRAWRLAARASVAGMVALSVGVALYDESLAGLVAVPKLVTAPVLAKALGLVATALLVPSVLASLASLVVRYRISQGLARRQVAVLLGAAAVLVAVTLAQGLVPSPADVLAQAAAVALLPLAVGVAVTRHRLYDLDLAVCRALVAASLTACLIGAYLSVFAVVEAVVGALGPERSVLSAAVAAGVTGAVIQPLGRRLAAGVDRLYFGHRAEPYVVSSHLASRLSASPADMSEVPGLVCDTVVEDLRLRGARLRLESGDTVTEAASTGDVDDATSRRFPLRHRGETVGHLEVSPRDGERRLHERDVVVLQGVADQAAPAVAALELRRALQRSRASIVAARETERRRLRQELHDGIGATLAGLRLQVETALDLTDSAPAASLLASASEGVAIAVAEVRTICEGLRPPGIDDLGLPGALAALAARMAGPGLCLDVRVDDRLDLDPAVEVAVHRIAAEALANVARHSGAGRATLALHADSHVELVVSDDGVGLDAARGTGTAGSGLGLPSMRQRAEEVGGRLHVAPGPDGGTEVRAILPLTVGGTT
ncbi:sensor histidine kinase [Nocardioides sp. MAHUQ-72]|uniref:sensor histidine kinase n=1 Tax=unclassified Nocardioides TaxID=2615069 RepID=UPI00362349A3